MIPAFSLRYQRPGKNFQAHAESKDLLLYSCGIPQKTLSTNRGGPAKAPAILGSPRNYY
jgi:hypothetical protein